MGLWVLGFGRIDFRKSPPSARNPLRTNQKVLGGLWRVKSGLGGGGG